ncbi:ESX secretion-associated protein EspG [Nocardia asteroides]|uniref:ESX secretion-associated protein EspG n=1 Tax=Nocardia asteroides TaxID=1824 RepID=UPI001E2B29A0|nr:ESX secretion-associated protein EspG [Nocardia asteroides]UGT59999.1 ESX secretion-associated protein EspG [Nocardia asteroides]
MTRGWELSPVEFTGLWAARRESVPEPFFHLPEPGSTWGAGRRRRAEAVAEVRARLGGVIDDVLDAVTRPDIRLVVSGMSGTDPAEPAARLRMLATRTGDRGFLITQLPGRSGSEAAGYTITEQDVLELGAVVTAALPDREAGRKPGFVYSAPVDRGDHDYDDRRSLVRDTAADPAAGRSAEFERARLDQVGSITVQQGSSRFGPRGISTVHLYWRDLTDDGRYAVVPGRPMTVVPADRPRMTGLVDAGIAEIVRAIRDDRA